MFIKTAILVNKIKFKGETIDRFSQKFQKRHNTYMCSTWLIYWSWLWEKVTYIE